MEAHLCSGARTAVHVADEDRRTVDAGRPTPNIHIWVTSITTGQTTDRTPAPAISPLNVRMPSNPAVPTSVSFRDVSVGNRGKLSPVGGLDSRQLPSHAYKAFRRKSTWLRPSGRSGQHDVLPCGCQ